MEKKLRRTVKGAMLAGVCSGIAYYFDLSASSIRIAFVLLCIFGGVSIFVYIGMWIIIPMMNVQERAEYNAYLEDKLINRRSRR